MSVFQRHTGRMLRFLFLLTLCFTLLGSTVAQAAEDPHDLPRDYPFSVLILGDSEMAGTCWTGGYANCITETYANAKVINLAVGGSMLATGDIHAQLEFFLEMVNMAPDFVLLDGGVNDLPHLQRDEMKESGLTIVSGALCSLIEQIHEVWPDTHIVYLLMPPVIEWKDDIDGPPSYQLQERYWRHLNKLASSYDYVTVLDLFSLNPFHYPCATCYKTYFGDIVHFSEAGYRKTFEHIDNIFTAILAEKHAK